MFTNHRIAGDRSALFDSERERWLDYRTLRLLVAERAAELGAASKKLAFCFLPNSADAIIDMLALLEASHVVALLDPTLPASMCVSLFSSYEPDFVLGADCPAVETAMCLPKARKSPRSGRLHFIRLDHAAGRTDIHPELSLMLSTSGSTGSPKFVRLSHQNITSNAAAIAQVLEIGETERVLAHLPLHYSFGFSVISSHLSSGASVVPTSESLASGAFWKLFREHHCTALPGVPSHFDILKRLDIDRLRVPTLVRLMQAGGRMRPEMIKDFAAKMSARSGRLYVMYGQTEASPRITTLPAEEALSNLGSVGPALPGGRLEIRDEKGGHLPSGAIGEVVYFGPNVMMGYATSRAELAHGYQLKDGLHTGDLGYLDDRGYLTLSGRANRFAKVHGIRVSLDEVERMLSGYGTSAAVEAGENKVAVVVLQAKDTKVIHAELVERLRLPPSAIIVQAADMLPIKANGKIDYAKIRAIS
jgi:acyl-CoA synthetase (AMP-forming)/AMP-acid ligase II